MTSPALVSCRFLRIPTQLAKGVSCPTPASTPGQKFSVASPRRPVMTSPVLVPAFALASCLFKTPTAFCNGVFCPRPLSIPGQMPLVASPSKPVIKPTCLLRSSSSLPICIPVRLSLARAQKGEESMKGIWIQGGLTFLMSIIACLECTEQSTFYNAKRAFGGISNCRKTSCGENAITEIGNCGFTWELTG
jgi:hypothetical protein